MMRKQKKPFEAGRGRLVGCLLLSIPILVLILVCGAFFCSCGGKAEEAVQEVVEENKGGAYRTTSPFTGLPLKDGTSASRRAVAVKVENDVKARPQSGLDLAELVYEEIVEGDITRFIALYLDNEPSEIGPIRSVRPMDVNVLAAIDPLLAVSGGSPGVLQILEGSQLHFITENDANYFWRARDRRAPHNLYTSGPLLRSALRDKNIEFLQWKGDFFRFGTPEDALPAVTIDVGYLGPCRVSYQYDQGSGKYLRSMGGQPMLDKISGQQVAPASVVIQYVDLQDTGVRDMAGSVSPDAVVTGYGEARIFTDGKVYSGSWERASGPDRTVFRDAGGKEIILKPGQVWVHLIPKSIRVDYRAAP
jgi:hypothetical protein